jgi:iron complex outermembrane recepter protein
VLVNRIDGDPSEPAPIKAAKSSILNAQIKSLLTESRPKFKVILGIDYTLGAWTFNLNNTLFGPTAFRDFDNASGLSFKWDNRDTSINAANEIKALFKSAVVTDLSIGYTINKSVSVGISINNIFNVVPKWDLVQETVNADPNAALQAVRVAAANKLLATPDDKALLRGFLGFSGRYDILGYNGSQFSQLGTIFNANLNIKF